MDRKCTQYYMEKVEKGGGIFLKPLGPRAGFDSNGNLIKAHCRVQDNSKTAKM